MNTLDNLNVTVQQAVAFLTAPLLESPIPFHAVDKLQRALISSLTTRFSATGQWDTRQPEIGSESRAMRLSTACPPPTYIARACEASGVEWAHWLFLLGGGHGLDLDLFVDPGRVSVCFRKHGCHASDLATVWKLSDTARSPMSTRELLAHDDDSEIFALINEKVNSPSWVSSWNKSAAPPRADSCLPTSLKVPKISPVPISRAHLKAHSRSSSSSSLFSGSSHASGSPSKSSCSISDEESMNWRQPRTSSDSSSVSSDKPKNRSPKAPAVVVDTTKTAVITHDGGKTRVVGGGVMLGSMNTSSRRR